MEREEDKGSVERNAEMVMAMLAHELRNGFLTTILTLEKIDKYKGKEKKEKISGVVKKLQRLEFLMNGILTREIILNTGGVPHLELLDFREILDGVLEFYVDDFKDAGKKIDRGMGYIPGSVVIIKSNAAILELAVHTILNNQVKYGGTGLAYGYREDENHFYLTFYNDGAPIPDWLKEKLFKTNAREYYDKPGAGFGLLGAQRLLGKIGATLLYEETGGHPLFIIRIPKEI